MILQEATVEDLSDSPWLQVSQVASRSEMKYKIGAALIDKKGRILCVGNNTNKSHPKYGSKAPWKTMHAEGNCIFSAAKLGINTEGLTMIVYRKGGLNSKPCPDCEKLIRKMKIKKVIYS